MVQPDTMELVDEIRRRGLSRNQHFALLSQREYRQAMRVKRYLEGLAAELTRLARNTEEQIVVGLRTLGPPGGNATEPPRYVLNWRQPRLGLERRSYLSAAELAYLRRHHPEATTQLPDPEGAVISGPRGTQDEGGRRLPG